MKSPSFSGMHPGRVLLLNGRPVRDGEYVLYWMQQSQRTYENHALEYAIGRANALRRPVMVGFGLTAAYPDANLRHYTFMLQGLRDVSRHLAKRKIPLVLRIGAPDEIALQLGHHACLIVCDAGYLRHQKCWRSHVAKKASCEVTAVESGLIVPAYLASNKREYAARTFRPKINRLAEDFMSPLRSGVVKYPMASESPAGLDPADVTTLLERLAPDDSVSVSEEFTGGESAARGALSDFVKNRLAGYAVNRSLPQTGQVSYMGMYLHFGQISPALVARTIRDAPTGSLGDRRAFLEELIVRRELTHNFVHYTPDYDSFSCLPRWAARTLAEHRTDPRPYLYSRRELETARTHDPYWNAAMREMICRGYLHNHMRMYWGKKILEWSATPQQAYVTALSLNNKYFIDGRDANSFANIGWIFGLHDRPWARRKIFGTVRIMTTAGLERKSHPLEYVAMVRKKGCG